MKISVVSLCLQTVVDAYLCLFHSTLAMMNGKQSFPQIPPKIESEFCDDCFVQPEPLFSIFATAAFLEFVVFALFELRYEELAYFGNVQKLSFCHTTFVQVSPDVMESSPPRVL